MKKQLFILLSFFPTFIFSQNVQLHYDFGRYEDGTHRDFFVSTFEMFKPDSLGYTFLFIDFEFDSPDNPRGVSLGYFEISREFYMPWFKKNKFINELGLHVEYNDGSLIYSDENIVYGENLRGSWLAGLGYPVRPGGFTLNTMLLYKYIRGSVAPDFQLTFAWYHFLFNDKVTISGFLDFWSQDDFYGDPEEKVLVIYGEPQLWYNITPYLAVGSEVKIGYNFYPGSSRTEFFPTLGVKWEF
ncbi:MAG: DUF5020 family protein [Bacteroidales bacterium]|nr:DUF5020 family protein [Bacteroidales bacterium]